MKWIRITIKTMAEAVDLISDMLNEIGIEGIEIVDNVPITEEEKKAMFIDILPEVDVTDKTAVINCYLEIDTDIQKTTEEIKAGLDELSQFIDVGSGEVIISETEDKDWINNWKEFFKPFRVDETIVIKPTWETLEEVSEDDLVIEIDPGTAFGTGSHETTKLCILGLKKYLEKGVKLLDVGFGSGILSIIGAKLGAEEVVATDIDPNAVVPALENLEVNGIIGDKVQLLTGDIISDADFQKKIGLECYDIVVANILADVIIPLSGVIGRHIKPGGLFISSGIIQMKRAQVEEAINKNGFTIVEVKEMGDWVSIVARK